MQITGAIKFPIGIFHRRHAKPCCMAPMPTTRIGAFDPADTAVNWVRYGWLVVKADTAGCLLPYKTFSRVSPDSVCYIWIGNFATRKEF